MVREKKYKYIEVVDDGKRTAAVILRSNQQMLTKFHIFPQAGNIKNSEMIQNQAGLWENYIKSIVEPKL